MHGLTPLDTLIEKLSVFLVWASYHGLVRESLDKTPFGLFCGFHINGGLLEPLSEVHGQVDFCLGNCDFFATRE